MVLTTPNLSTNSSRQLMRVPPPALTKDDAFRQHKARIEAELEEVGVPWYGRAMRAVQHLPRLIHTDEHLEAVVCGWETALGTALLVSTDRRIIFIVKKLFFIRDDEIGFKSVRGVSYVHSPLVAGVVLHTQIGDYNVKTLNRQCVETFMKSIERHGLEGAGL